MPLLLRWAFSFDIIDYAEGHQPSVRSTPPAFTLVVTVCYDGGAVLFPPSPNKHQNK